MSSAKRDIRLDALRGLFLVVMVMDHFPSWLNGLTYESIGYVTAAEGFVFLSGYVAGQVYGRYSAGETSRHLWWRAVLRALRIYGYHATTLVILFTAAAVFKLKTFGLENWAPQFYSHPLPALGMGLILCYQPHFLDILPMYCLFILFTPVVVKSRKLWHFSAILTISLLAWLTVQFGAWKYFEDLFANIPTVYFGTFDPLAWQLLFILGVMAGKTKVFEFLSAHPLRKALLAFCLIVAVGLYLLRHQVFLLHHLGINVNVDQTDSLATKNSLGPIRLLNFAVVAVIVGGYLVWPASNPCVKALGYLGRYSIQVFSFHLLTLYFVYGKFLHSSSRAAWACLSVLSLSIPAAICHWARSTKTPACLKVPKTELTKSNAE